MPPPLPALPPRRLPVPCPPAPRTPPPGPQSNTPQFPPTACGTNYTYTVSSGATIVPGTTDIGNHTDDGTTNITLPFSFTLYDTSVTQVAAGSNGGLFF